MAWEWLTPVTSSVLGVAAIVGTTMASAGGRRHDRLLAEENCRHQDLSAHVQWIRDHRRDAYLGLLDMAEEAGQHVRFIHPMWGPNPPQVRPELPDLAAQRKVKARVVAFGSPAVNARMDDWVAVVSRATAAAAAVLDGAHDGRQQLHDLREEERKAREALGRLIAEELQRPGPGGSS